MKKFHIVAKNDTLLQIAEDNSTSVETLKKINGIVNINKIFIGQKIYLRKEYALGVQVLFLDIDRNPIPNLEYFLDFCGKTVKGNTLKNGLTERIFTEQANDKIKISISRLDKTIKTIGTVTSGKGNKLFTIVTPRYRADAKTEPDPHGPASTRTKQPPIHDNNSRPPPTTDKKDLGPKVAPTKTKDGSPSTKVEGDISNIDLFLDKYSPKEVSNEDIREAAKKLRCKPGLIFAIAKQESSTSSFFEINGRKVPKILYERHIFRDKTKPKGATHSPYESQYPDICGPAYHRTRKNKKNELIDVKTGALARPDDIYGPSGVAQYKRLLKAYQLNPDCALMACSWGKFQIMGFNFERAGFTTVHEFVRAMSRNDAEHMKAFLHFAGSNGTLLSGLRTSNFEKIAEGHNGAEWRSINPEYADNLRKFYDQYVAEHGEQ